MGRRHKPEEIIAKLRQVEASIADGEHRLTMEVANVVRSLASDVTVQTEREAQLVQSIANLKDQIQKAGSAMATLASLEQEAEVRGRRMGSRDFEQHWADRPQKWRVVCPKTSGETPRRPPIFCRLNPRRSARTPRTCRAASRRAAFCRLPTTAR